MLQQLRHKSGSIVVWTMFAIIIAAFVLFFGPQAGPDMLGCGASSDEILKVNGETIGENGWKFAINGTNYKESLFGRGLSEPGQRLIALDHLVEREILAQAALEQDFAVSDEFVDASITQGIIYVLGHKIDAARGDLSIWGGLSFFRDGIFEYELVDTVARRYFAQTTVDAFRAEQKRELLANLMRTAILDSVLVSDEEARQLFVTEQTLVTFDYLAFDAKTYEQQLSLDEAGALAFADANPEWIQKAWDRESTTWTSERPRILARHIFIAKPEDGNKDGVESARTKIAEARQRIEQGQSFEQVALESSNDKETAGRGGRIGWRPADSLGYGNELVKAIGDLEPGKISEVVETPKGFHVVRVDERADGALTLAQKRLDLAFEHAPKAMGAALAKRDAEAALARAKEQKISSLSDIYQRQFDPAELQKLFDEAQKNPPKLPPPNPKPSGETSGFLYREGPTMVAKRADDQAKETAAEGSAQVVPQVNLAGISVEVKPPFLQTTKSAPRSGDFISEVGTSRPLVDAVFDGLVPGQLGEQVFAVTTDTGDSRYVVAQLTERVEADLDLFPTQADDYKQRLQDLRAAPVLAEWIKKRCEALVANDAISVSNRALLLEDNKLLPYSACSTLSTESVTWQVMLRQAFEKAPSTTNAPPAPEADPPAPTTPANDDAKPEPAPEPAENAARGENAEEAVPKPSP